MRASLRAAGLLLIVACAALPFYETPLLGPQSPATAVCRAAWILSLAKPSSNGAASAEKEKGSFSFASSVAVSAAKATAKAAASACDRAGLLSARAKVADSFFGLFGGTDAAAALSSLSSSSAARGCWALVAAGCFLAAPRLLAAGLAGFALCVELCALPCAWHGVRSGFFVAVAGVALCAADRFFDAAIVVRRRRRHSQDDDSSGR